MKLAFSTLGCPKWTLNKIAEAVRKFGYDAVELRAVDGEIDLLSRPEFSSSQLAQTHRWLTDEGVAVCCIDTSCVFHSRDKSERSAQVETALRHMEIAAALATPLIRVFPDQIQPGASREETRDNIADCLRQIAERSIGEVSVGLETHGDFARAESAVEIVRLADHRGISIIWDVANSVAAGDSIDSAAQIVGPYLTHVHLRDARPVEGQEHWLPVLAGKGKVSFADAFEGLTKLKYEEFVSFEWEKYWHAELEEPEVALPDFVRNFREIRKLTSVMP